jgi:hypothetical protein
MTNVLPALSFLIASESFRETSRGPEESLGKNQPFSDHIRWTNPVIELMGQYEKSYDKTRKEFRSPLTASQLRGERTQFWGNKWKTVVTAGKDWRFSRWKFADANGTIRL